MVIFRVAIVIFFYSFFLYSRNIMIVPLGVNYNKEKEEEIGSHLFDTINSAILDTNVHYNINSIDSNIFVKEGLLPNNKYQKNIYKFYKKAHNIDYLKSISSSKNIDILVFMNIHKSKSQKEI